MDDAPSRPGTDDESTSARRRAEAERARRRARVFGDVLPEATDDDRPPPNAGDEGGATGDGDEEWLRANVPPHHG